MYQLESNTRGHFAPTFAVLVLDKGLEPAVGICYKHHVGTGKARG